MLHIRTWFRLEYSLQPSWDCVIRSFGERNSRQLLPIAGGVPFITVQRNCLREGHVSLAFPFLLSIQHICRQDSKAVTTKNPTPKSDRYGYSVMSLKQIKTKNRILCNVLFCNILQCAINGSFLIIALHSLLNHPVSKASSAMHSRKNGFSWTGMWLHYQKYLDTIL